MSLGLVFLIIFGTPFGVAGLVLFGLWFSDGRAPHPRRLIWYPLWFISAVVVAIVVVLPAVAIKAIQPINREADA